MPSCCSLPVNPDELAVPLPKAFARRLYELYGLKRAPKDLKELIALRREAGRLPFSAELLESSVPTRHEVQLKGKRLYVHCALDAFMYPLLVAQDAQIRSRCPACKHVIEVAIKGGKLIAWAPEAAVLWLGASSKGGACGAGESDFSSIRACVCPFINLFDVTEHLEAWRTKNEGVLGVPLTLSQAFELAKGLTEAS